MDFSVDKTYDQGLIYSCVLPLFEDIVEDGTSLNALNGYVNLADDIWLVLKRGDELLGVVQFTAYNSSMIEIHPFIQREKRRYSLDCARLSLMYVDNHLPDSYKSVITNIPACKRYAKLFAQKVGFKEVGRFKNGFFKDSKHHDMILFQRGRQNG